LPLILPDRPLRETAEIIAGSRLPGFEMGLGEKRDGRRQRWSADSGHLHDAHRPATINRGDGDGGGDDGDDGGLAPGWPLPKRQRLRIRGSFFVAIAWGSHLLNTDVSIREIGASDGARCRPILISKTKTISASKFRFEQRKSRKIFSDCHSTVRDAMGFARRARCFEKEIRSRWSRGAFAWQNRAPAFESHPR
jgi:hypothetical protein